MRTESFKEEGINIDTSSHSVFGILTEPIHFSENGVKKPLVVLVPAISGTRIGPQRIFVEISRDIARLGYSSYRMDMASAGDAIERSNRIENDSEHHLISWYKGYLDTVTSFFNELTYNYGDYIFLSISLGCEPILKYAIKKSYDSVIFLSPTYLDYIDKKKINKKNVKAYYYKLFKKSTWVKLFQFQLNWNNIFRNIIPKKRKVKPKVFGIYGELDIEFQDSKIYWKTLENDRIISKFEFEIVKGSDHNFFGFKFKKDLKFIIEKWFNSL